MSVIVVAAMAVLAGTFTYECIGLASAIERLTDATYRSNALALQRPAVAKPPSSIPVVTSSVQSPSLTQDAFRPPAIDAVTDTEYSLDRRLVELLLEDQVRLMRSVRIVPVSTNGRTYPRLFGIGPDSLLRMLGFQNGDCLETINGFDLSTPERAMEAYARLRTADHLEVRVRRRGQTVTLHYDVS
jgi:general secretion pathway protein C